MSIDPGIITLAQTTFLQHLNVAINKIVPYAFNLLYIFTAIELTILGLIWALQQTPAWGKVFFKVIKIGLIFFILQNYVWLLDTIVQSFGKLAGIVVHKSTLSEFIFNPAKIWQYGYDVGIFLLKAATASSGFGLILIQTILGMGILLTFGLFGIQLTIQIIAFYVTAVIALILLPLGVFEPSRKIFDKALQSILQAGVRLMVIILIVGIATIIWEQIPLADLTSPDANLNAPLGLFFSALLFSGLAMYLPRMIAATVGGFSALWRDQTQTAESSIIVTTPVASANLGTMQAATTIETNAASSLGMASQANNVTPVTSVSITTPPSGLFTSNLMEPRTTNNKSISDATLNKLAQTLTETLKKQ